MTKETFEYARRIHEKKINISFVDEAEVVLLNNRELAGRLADKDVPLSVKYDAIEQNFPVQIRDFLCDLCKDGKINLISDIAKTFREVPLDHKEPFTVKLTYVTPPTEDQYDRIRTFIFHKFKRRDTVFEEQKDESLIGGFTLRAGNQEFDWSLKGRLQQLQKTLDEYQHQPNGASQGILSVLKQEISEFELEAENKQVGIIDLMRDNLMGENGIGQIRTEINDFELEAENKEIGIVERVGDGIAKIKGINHAMYGEILLFDNGVKGMVQDIHKDDLGCILFSSNTDIGEGSKVIRTEKMAGIPVGDEFLGRVIDALGMPIDGLGPIQADDYRPIENDAPGIIDRKSVSVPLETGILSIDSMFPIGRGQRELIIGDRQTGKTSIAIDTILNQRGKNVVCIYVAIGQKASTIAKIVNTLKTNNAMEYTTVVAATASDSAPLQYIAPYSGTALAEHFMYAGKDVLIVYDDLSKHAVAYRSLSLLLERSPGREAYPGDVFYLHSRLLERSSRLTPEKGGGSITALPIIETQAGDVSAYIPTNVISITDGQIFLESDLFFSGMRPAVNIGLSVSRVGGAAQTKAMKKAAGSLRISLAQYREMEIFTQFSSDLDSSTRELLQYGRGLMELLKQPLCNPLSMHDQVITLVAATNKVMLDVPTNKMKEFQNNMIQFFEEKYPEIGREIEIQKSINDELITRIITTAKEFKRQVYHM